MWICQCMPEPSAAPCFCSRYMPTLRPPVFGSRVITDGRVMNGPPSSGQQVMIGSESSDGWSSTISWQGALLTVFGRASANDLSLPSVAELVGQALRRRQLEHVRELAGHVVEPLDAEGQAHAPLGPELVDQQRVRRALHPAEEQRGAAALHRAVGDLGDLEVGIDLGVDLRELALAPEQVDPLAKVARDHLRSVRARGGRPAHARPPSARIRTRRRRRSARTNATRWP